MRTTAGRVALVLVLCLVLGNPGCGCGTDTVLLTACACVGTFDFLTPPPAPLPLGVTLVNLERDLGNGSIGFGPTLTTFPSVFMAASGRGTIVRIDVNTGALVGEYRTSPQTNTFASTYAGPSRTTVDKFGECWVGNRTDIFDSDTAHPGSVTRIGIVTGGTRGDRLGPLGGPYTFSANPTGQYFQGPFTYQSPSVVDRDGDGFIRTSFGQPVVGTYVANGSIYDWDAALSGTDDGGGVTTADDECIVNFTRVACSGTRGLAIDCENDLWVGGTGNVQWQEVDGTSGVAGIIRPFSTAYGGAIDVNGVIWSVGYPFAQHNIAANTTNYSIPPNWLYGIAIDPCTTNIWTSGGALLHWSPAGAVAAGPFPWVGSGFYGHGLCVDPAGDVWVAGGTPGVARFNSAGVYQTTINTGVATTVYAKGTAVDQNGKIWVADLLGDKADRIDPGTNLIDLSVPMGAGAGPYNYSDMTGLAALSSCGGQGYLIATHDGLCAGSQWGRVSLTTTGTNLAGCTVTAEVRASDDPLNFPTFWTPVASGTSFCGAPPVFGRYVQIRVTIQRPTACGGCDPRLTSLQIECCDQADFPPIVVLNGPFNIPNPPAGLIAPLGGKGAGVSVTVSGVVTDPDGDPLTARWSIDGSDAGAAVLDQAGNTEITRDFFDGVTVVALTASDGRNVTTRSTTVTVGDQEAPVVTCPSGPPISGGQIVVRAFEAQIPDLVSGTVATDDQTPTPVLILSQSPAPGTVVQQGTHPIVVTATDQAGNQGTCTVIFRVNAVLAVSSPPKYQFFTPMSPILVAATYFPPGGTVLTQVIVDGGIFTSVMGEMVGPIDIGPLPVGVHIVKLSATNGGGVVSESDEVLFEVQ